jgi:hypothetical protein
MCVIERVPTITTGHPWVIVACDAQIKILLGVVLRCATRPNIDALVLHQAASQLAQFHVWVTVVTYVLPSGL